MACDRQGSQDPIQLPVGHLGPALCLCPLAASSLPIIVVTTFTVPVAIICTAHCMPKYAMRPVVNTVVVQYAGRDALAMAH